MGEASWFYGFVLLRCVGAPLFLFSYRAVFREGCSVFGAVFFCFRRFVERAVQVRLSICQHKEDESKGEWDARPKVAPGASIRRITDCLADSR